MKKILYLLVLFPILVIGQTQSENYTKTTTYKVATTLIPSPSESQKNVSITYFDGLGRPIQKQAHKQSASGKDVVTHLEYDAFGRQVKEYLPYVPDQNTMAYIDATTAQSGTVAQYQTMYGDTIPYSEKIFEASPLNRVMEQAAPGNDWSLNNSTKHTIRLDYQTNISNEVKLFKATSDGTNYNTLGYYNPLLTDSGYYDPNQLYKTITKDENWIPADGNNNTTEEFKDKEGRVVLKRAYGVSMINNVAFNTQHNTYYVYDQYGNLTFVIPPLVDSNASITPIILEKLCYQYQYDYRNRLVEKKLPGKQWEFIVYDKLDRVVATGPANSPFENLSNTGWMLTKYDVFNRPVLTAWQPSTTAITSEVRKSLQDLYSAAALPVNETKTTVTTTVKSVSFRYTNAAIPAANATLYHVLTVNYYDDYDSNLFFSPAISFTANTDVYYNNTTQKPKGLPTMSWVRVATTSTAISFEQNYTLYDSKARAVRTFARNYAGGYTQSDIKLDFVGKVNYSLTTHKRTTSTSIPLLTIREDFTYSDQDRLLTHTHSINGGTPELLASNTYNELGQLISKNVGQSVSNPIQKVDYSYNIRGWLKGINDVTNLTDPVAPSTNAALDLFAFKINYNTQDNNIYGVNNLYNGNISETLWRSSKDNILRSYGYTYDALNRLRDAQYIRPVNPDFIQSPTNPNGNPDLSPIVGTFNESMQYDKNGNIVALQRNGGMESQTQAPLIDNLVYQYDGNQLTKVDDSASITDGFKDGLNNPGLADYTYDLNGNMKTDQNKGIMNAISYNHLNLPTKITLPEGVITYVYNALGQKVSKTVNKIIISPTIASSNTQYLGGFQYNNNVLQFFPTAEGYVKNTVVNGANSYDYIFNYTDHLGNIRLSYGIAPSTHLLTIFEENNYYPFGLKHGNYNNQLKGIVNLKDYPSLDTPMDEKVAKTLSLDIGETVGNINFIANSGYQYKYNGKEYQDELGLNFYDYGARNYDPAIGRWMNVDPLAEQYRRWSPYNYCVDNPMRFVDPDGMGIDDITVNGPQSKEAISQLQASVGTDITINRDSGSGNVTYTNNTGAPLTGNAAKLASVIDDHSVNVNVNADNSNNSIEYGEAFMGNTVTSNVDSASGKNIVNATQAVNTRQTASLDASANKPGATILHGVVEASEGAKMSQASGVSSPQAGAAGSVYQAAHNAAELIAPQPAQIEKVFSYYGASNSTRTGIGSQLAVGLYLGNSKSSFTGAPPAGTVSITTQYYNQTNGKKLDN
ncbi:MAG: DUF6443 domain-containing protein [Flavobacterium sp.]